MTGGDNYYGQVGDNINVYGRDNIGKIGHQYNAPRDTGPAAQAALEELLALIAELRTRVRPDDRQVLDESLDTLSGEPADPGAFRRALGAVSGIAQLVGELGVPVAAAVRRVVELFGV
ncbi:hypothetical protein [Streptomyces sp. NPDC089919]|uniref:hypothetical protein n=1 Tax=Streptomyces sp. NPDC089919 TaxID=3155188 RepID=UPI003441EE9B